MGYIWGVVEVISKTLKKSGQPVIKIWRKIFEDLKNENGKKPNTGYDDAIEKMEKML